MKWSEHMKTDEKLGKTVEISIKHKKKAFKGNVVRAAIFARCKVIEATHSNDVRFYLIYYKNSLIYGDEIGAVQEGSFIDKAFRQGIVYVSPHPILSHLLPREAVLIPNKKKLFSHLQDRYSLPEIAYIATCLDSFFTKEQLEEIIQKIFDHFKRNGNHLKAYQVIRMLKEFVPDSSAAQDRFNSLEFHTYHELYRSDLASIREKDPLYYEQYCFENRFKAEERALLKSMLEEQNRSLESLLYWVEEAGTQQTVDSVEKYTSIALKHFSCGEWLSILTRTNVNPFKELPESKSYIENMVENQKYQEATALLLAFAHDLPDDFLSLWKSLWPHLDTQFVIDHLVELTSAMNQFSALDERKPLDPWLHNLAIQLFKENDLHTVQQKLSPVKNAFPHSAVLRKIDNMSAWSEDPDRMMQLGKYYAEFEQFDEAIECFFLEMEFHPEDASPVWQLSKMYQYKGMVSEAEAYQQFFTELKKKA